MQAAGADGDVLSTDLNEAIALCTAVCWHSSYPWTTTQFLRQLGGSIVVLYDGEGNSFVGLLKLFKRLLWTQRGNGEWGRDTLA